MQKDQLVDFFEFEKLIIVTGTILKVREFPEAHKPALKLWIDFGPRIGTLKSSAQIRDNYCNTTLLGKSVIALVNIPNKNIGSFISECLVLGVLDESGKAVLISPDTKIPNGNRLC